MRTCTWTRGAVFAFVLAGPGAACQTRPAPPAAAHRTQAGGRMSDLVQQVRAKDPSATLLAAELGPAAAPTLVPLTRDADEEVREIALLCLAETGGAGAVRAMLARLNDSAPMVRSAALKGLEQQAGSGDVPALLHGVEATDDAGARRYLALITGRLGSASDLPTLQRVCSRFTDDESAEGCLTALAQLGDPAARAEFARRLTAARDRELARFLEYAERIKAPWLVPALAPLLSNLTPVRWIGVDGLPGPENLRAADIAVNLIAAITGKQFSFPLSPRVNYTPEQLEEVRRTVGG
ncbi:MAG: HEAT repeat domain-containing protein [Bacillota bacterium]